MLNCKFADSWQSLSPKEMREKWGESKTDSLIEFFHGDALKSTKFEFKTEEVKDFFQFKEQDRDNIRKLYSRNLSAYVKCLALKI